MKPVWLGLFVISVANTWVHGGVSLQHADQLSVADPGEVVVRGFVGERVDANASGILLHKDEHALLDPFRNRIVGGHPWIGEHVGKWLSAAARSCMYYGQTRLTEDNASQNARITPARRRCHTNFVTSGGRRCHIGPALAAKLQRVAHGLIDTQLDDGYLGTYGKSERWSRWDVWIHKYNLLGLLDYYEATGDERALDACRRMADGLMNRFGPDRHDILASANDGGVIHDAMPSTSVLEPFVRLYRHTGDAKHLAFAEYIADSIEREGGSQIVTTMLAEREVHKVSNAKAYEMISNILGLLQMYRVQGPDEYLHVARIAFNDITENRSYVTGGSTFGEFFKEKGHLPNAGHVSEMCVMMSQLQLARELMLIRGDARYGHAAERLILNHLLAGQHPSGERVCYYTPLWGHKTYMNFLGCCISSAPRAISLIPSVYYLRGQDRLVVNLLGASEVHTRLDNGEAPRVVQETQYPFGDRVRIHAAAPAGIGYTLAVRLPRAANDPTVVVDGDPLAEPLVPGEYVEIPVKRDGVTIEIDLNLRWQTVQGSGANAGLFALQYGPVVFAYDHDHNRNTPRASEAVFDRDVRQLVPELVYEDGHWLARVNGYVPTATGQWRAARLTLLPYADAGVDGYFSVWLKDRAGDPERRYSLFTDVHERASRYGEERGSIVDNDPATFTTTRDGRRRDEDWFEVDASWYCRFNVIVFHHGKAFADGGWFDTSGGKPRVLVKTWHDYEEIAVLDAYPETTATDPGSLEDGQPIRVVIPEKHRDAAFRIRIAGTPAHGNDPGQNFAGCGDIQVFYDPDL